MIRSGRRDDPTGSRTRIDRVVEAIGSGKVPAMFAWLLRHVLLKDVPPDTRATSIAHPEVFALLRFRFAYLFAFHAPVLLPLLDALAGQTHPSLSVLSLGLASLTMVLADVPTGFYADRYGAKASLRLGLLSTSAIMGAFFALAVARVLWPARAVSFGPPAVLCLEASIGVSLALLSSADTVLFLQVAKRSRIAGLLHPSFEGVGSSIRYLGTMVAVLLGAMGYDLCGLLFSKESVRVLAQSSLFLCTLAAQLAALRDLSKLADEPAPLSRPGLQELLRGLSIVTGYPRFFAKMWLLSMVGAMALFAVYLLQSPLSRLATQLVREHPPLWPLYTVVSVLGYFACSLGSKRFARKKNEAIGSFGLRSVGLFGVCLGLLLLCPFAVFASPPGGVFVPLLLACIAVSLLFNAIRGFTEPYSAATVFQFTQQQGGLVPVSVVSLFSSLKRGAHFLCCAGFFLLQRTAAAENPDQRLSRSLVWLSLGFLLVCLPFFPRLLFPKHVPSSQKGP